MELDVIINYFRILFAAYFILTIAACGSELESTQENITDDPVPPAGSSSVLYTYSFDSAADQDNPEGPDGSAELYATKGKTTTTYNASGAWDNNSFLRVQLLDNAEQNDAGLFIFLDQLNLTGQMNIGWIARFGSSFINLTETNKMIMFRVGDGTGAVHNESPQMIVTPAHNPTGYHVPQITTNPANGGRQDEFGRNYPSDFFENYTFRFEEYANEWVYYEIQNDPITATVTLSIFTRDGAIASIDLASTASATGMTRELFAFRFIGYLWPVSGTDANAYADIADMYVNDSYIGPPQGFVN